MKKTLFLLLSVLLTGLIAIAQPDIDSAAREVDQPFRETIEKDSWEKRTKKIKIEERSADDPEEENEEDEDTPRIIIDRTE